MSKTFEIFLKDMKGRTFSIQLEREKSTSVTEIKILSKKRLGLSESEKVVLVYLSKTLKEGKYLYDYGIERYSTIHCLLRLMGGGGGVEFKSSSMDKDKMTIMKLSDSAPSYRWLTTGLNVDGNHQWS